MIAYSSTPGAALRVFGITAAPVTRNAGSPSASAQIATVNDAQGAPNTLSVTVTLNPTAPNASGQVFADVVAACTATTADFTLRVTDSDGLFTETTLTVTVNPDNQSPTINCAAVTAQSANADANCQAVVPDVRDLVRAQSSDNCTAQGSLTVTQNPTQAGTVSGSGSHPIKVTVTDASSNSTDCTVGFTVIDNTPPTIVCSQNLTVPTAPGLCSAIVTYAAPAVSDNCSGVGAPVCAPPSGTSFPKGTTMIACSVRDASNNQSNCAFSVTVVDQEPPKIACPASLSIVATSSCPFPTTRVLTFPAPTASDNCPGVITVCNPPAGSVVPVGTTNVTCTATDTSTNTAQCSFAVRVFSFCLQDESSPSNFVFINAMTGGYEFYCGGVLIASGTGVPTNRGCIESIDATKGDRRVLILFDTTAQSGRGAGTATLQVGPNIIKCRITDQDMTDNSCSVSPVVRFDGK